MNGRKKIIMSLQVFNKADYIKITQLLAKNLSEKGHIFTYLEIRKIIKKESKKEGSIEPTLRQVFETCFLEILKEYKDYKLDFFKDQILRYQKAIKESEDKMLEIKKLPL